MLPDDWKGQIGRHDAIFYGAVGWPAKVPDHISLWGSLIQFRREFDQYVNLRPVRLMPGVPCPLADRKPGEIDFLVVRENTEGEYSSVGGRMFAGTEREFVVQEAIFTRTGVDRILRIRLRAGAVAPEEASDQLHQEQRHLDLDAVLGRAGRGDDAQRYPDVRVDQYHVDILTAHFVRNPHWFDVVVASNLFGDILSDLGPACTGTIGIAPSANLNPTRQFPSLFEPVHGSAPDIAGQGIANPIGQIWSAAMMLDFLGQAPGAEAARYKDAHDAILRAIEHVCEQGPRTRDMGGTASTEEVGRAIAAAI